MSAFLRKFKGGYGHYCPGCDGIHLFYTNNDLGPGPVWGFNGNFEQPTFTPSMRIFHPKYTDEDNVVHAEVTLCHYFLTDGVLNYLPDSTDHTLRGAVPLPPLPAAYSDDNYGWPT